MKPSDWETKWSREDKATYALQMFNSPRGAYILSQALHYGIKSLKEVKPEYLQERSNIEDMEIFREMLFKFPIMEPGEAKEMMEKLKENSQEKASNLRTEV